MDASRTRIAACSLTIQMLWCANLLHGNRHARLVLWATKQFPLLLDALKQERVRLLALPPEHRPDRGISALEPTNALLARRSYYYALQSPHEFFWWALPAHWSVCARLGQTLSSALVALPQLLLVHLLGGLLVGFRPVPTSFHTVVRCKQWDSSTTRGLAPLRRFRCHPPRQDSPAGEQHQPITRPQTPGKLYACPP
eukprot:3141980-Amphidinium_carterae.1